MTSARRTRGRAASPYARATTGRAYARRQESGGIRGWHARVAALLVLAGALAAGGVWLYHSPYVTVRDVRVVGTKTLDPNLVRASAGLEGQNSLALDIDSARARVMQLPEVEDARITREGFTGVRIQITERRAWGLWQVQGRQYPIDAEGYVLANTLPDEGAPVIISADAVEAPAPGQRVDPGAVELVRRIQSVPPEQLGGVALSWEHRQRDGLTAVLQGGLRVTFGDSRDMEYKLAALQAILARAQAEGQTVRAVDLRFGDRLSYR